MGKKLVKYAFLAWLGGSAYVTLEVLFRGRSHWTMLLLGGLCFVLIGLLNNVLPWELGLVWQVAIGTAMVTMLELLTGIIVNRRLGWEIWDYSQMQGNLLGQITPQFITIWIPLVLLAILLDDFIRWHFFNEREPHYEWI